MEIFTGTVAIRSMDLKVKLNEDEQFEMGGLIKRIAVAEEKDTIRQICLYISDIMALSLPSDSKIMTIDGLYLEDHKKEGWESANRYELFDVHQEMRMIAANIKVIEKKVIVDKNWYKYLNE